MRSPHVVVARTGRGPVLDRGERALALRRVILDVGELHRELVLGLSSTGVKEMATFGGDVSDLVPGPVAAAMARRLADR